MRRLGAANWSAVLFATVAVAMVVVTVGSAAPPSPSNPAGRILGVVPTKDAHNLGGGAGGNLSYHGGTTR
jgi:hypothetical protein